MIDPLPPGPAFIPMWCQAGCGFSCTAPDSRVCRSWHEVPSNYIWCPATDHTMAGWVRPSGGERDDKAA